MTESEKRGSEKMRLNLKTRTFQEEDLKRMIDFFEEKGIRLDDAFPLGKPNPEVIYGKLTVAPESIGQVLQELLKLDAAVFRTIKIFPLGIPFENILVEFESVAKY